VGSVSGGGLQEGKCKELQLGGVESWHVKLSRERQGFPCFVGEEPFFLVLARDYIGKRQFIS